MTADRSGRTDRERFLACMLGRTPDRIIPPMMRAGVYMFPFEVAAGCDVNRIRRRPLPRGRPRPDK